MAHAGPCVRSCSYRVTPSSGVIESPAQFEQVELRRDLEQGAGILRSLISCSDIAHRHADLQPPGWAGARPRAFAQNMKRHKLKFADAVALAADEGQQPAAFDRQVGAGLVVGRLSKSRQALEPVAGTLRTAATSRSKVQNVSSS